MGLKVCYKCIFLLLILTSITLTDLIITAENVNEYLQTNLINLLTFSALRKFSIIFYSFHIYEEIYKLR